MEEKDMPKSSSAFFWGTDRTLLFPLSQYMEEVDLENHSPAECLEMIIKKLEELGYLK